MSDNKKTKLADSSNTTKKRWTTPVLDQHAFARTETAKRTYYYGGESGPYLGPAS